MHLVRISDILEVGLETKTFIYDGLGFPVKLVNVPIKSAQSQVLAESHAIQEI